MPLTAKGRKIRSSLQAQYGDDWEHVFYGLKNKGKIAGVDMAGTAYSMRGRDASPLERLADIAETRFAAGDPAMQCDDFLSHMRDCSSRGVGPRDAIRQFTAGAAHDARRHRFFSVMRDEIFNGTPPRNAITLALGTVENNSGQNLRLPSSVRPPTSDAWSPEARAAAAASRRQHIKGTRKSDPIAAAARTSKAHQAHANWHAQRADNARRQSGGGRVKRAVIAAHEHAAQLHLGAANSAGNSHQYLSTVRALDRHVERSRIGHAPGYTQDAWSPEARAAAAASRSQHSGPAVQSAGHNRAQQFHEGRAKLVSDPQKAAHHQQAANLHRSAASAHAAGLHKMGANAGRRAAHYEQRHQLTSPSPGDAWSGDAWSIVRDMADQYNEQFGGESLTNVGGAWSRDARSRRSTTRA